MKKTTFALLIALFIALCFAHGAVGADVPTIKESDAVTLAKSLAKLKPAQWAMLPGLEIKVLATAQKTETGITVSPDEVYLVVPHPTDVWSQGPQATYKHVKWNDGELNLRWFIGADSTDASSAPEAVFIKGDGPLLVGHGDGNAGDNWGFIRVKLFKVVKAGKK
jgi:hypothetical protein